MAVVRPATAALLVGLLLAAIPAAAADNDWSVAAQPGHIALMRHAEAPGTGDPKGHSLDDCKTQRNLDERGRTQARAIGAAFATAGVKFNRTLTSAWCRCKETAALVTGADATVFPALNSFIANFDRGPAQAARVRQEIDAVAGFEPVLMVTHQVMITELTGIVPASGEVVVVRAKTGANGKLEVVARLRMK
jgi:phosphohistidine phosphatase SixA